MRKQDRIAQERQQPNRADEPPKNDSHPPRTEQEQIKGGTAAPRPQRQGGKLPLPD